MFRRRKTLQERDAEAGRLIREGYDALDEGRWRDAIRIARRIRPLRNSGYYDILARAQWKAKRVRQAIETLERGVTEYPQVAILWSYLGEYYSNTGSYDRAITAFERAASGIAGHRWLADYNIALVEWRRKRPEQALQKLWLIPPDANKPARWAVEDLRALALADLGRGEEALETADEALEHFDQPDDRATHARLMSTRAICLKAQDRRDEALSQCWKAIRTWKSEREACKLIRELTDVCSDRAREWTLLLQGRRRDDEGVRGFYTHYIVIADDAQEAFDYALEFEPADYREELSISKATARKAVPGERKGVADAAGYAFFPLER